MKRKLIFSLIVLFLFVNVSFVSSQELVDFGKKFMGLEEGEITGQRMEFEQNRLTFAESGANVELKGNNFKNIKSQKEAGLPSFIEVNDEGDITKAEFTSKGDCYTFGNTKNCVGPDTRVLFDEKTGIRIQPPEGSKLTETPTSLNQPGVKDYITTIHGKDVTLPNGAVIDGRLNYHKGQPFIALDDRTIINGVELTSGIDKLPKDYGGEINVFFDGQKHTGDYTSFDLKNKQLILASETNGNFIANFREGNSFLKIDKGDYVAMQALPGSEIGIQNRDSEGLIPRVTTKGNFILDEDSKSIIYQRGKVDLKKSSVFTKKRTSTTSPIELFPLDKSNSNIFKSGDKLFVDNFNRFAIGSGEKDFLASSERINTKFSSRITYNYPNEENIKALIGKDILFHDISDGNKDLVLGRLRDYWETITPETTEAIKHLEFGSDDYFKDVLKSGGGARTHHNGKIEFRGYDFFDFGVFRHEAAHARDFSIESQGNQEILELEGRMAVNIFKSEEVGKKLKIASENEKLILQNSLDGLNKEYFQLTDKISEIESNSNIFKNKWNEINKIPYDEKNAFLFKKNGLWDWEYTNNRGYLGPKSGFASPYGSRYYYEDMATFVQKINNPSFFEPLINPSSSEYNIIYRQKLDLLCEYKFISTQECNKIFQEIGI